VKNKTFYSNGKLLISGEYIVLDGAKSLAIPTKYGQYLIVEPIEENRLFWKSFDEQNKLWYQGEFSIKDNSIECFDANEVSQRLVQILKAAKKANPEFLSGQQGFKITTQLDFPTNWGLGTSSTLLNNIAQWANIDAYKLLEKTFGGSAYDIACAQHNTPIIYQIKNNSPLVNPITFNPIFKNHLYFVHLNKKQNSRAGIKHYKTNKQNTKSSIKLINAITSKMIRSNTLEDFDNLIVEHEKIIAKITKQTPVKDALFNDYSGSIKSLGAWGGDFILVTSKNNPAEYFKSKGYNTLIPYLDMVIVQYD
jgi:mevalonate kinase